jgi:hypothetical protein
MFSNHDAMQNVTSRSKHRDRGAAQLLRRTLDPNLPRMVREGLNDGGRSAFSRQVFVVARQVADTHRGGTTLDQFIDMIANRMSENLRAQCQSGSAQQHWCNETVPDSPVA